MANVAPVDPAAAALRASLDAIRAASSQVNHDDATATMNAHLGRIYAACHTFANSSTPTKPANQRPRLTEKLVSFVDVKSKHAYYPDPNSLERAENLVVNDFYTGRCDKHTAPNCLGPRIAVVTQRIGDPFGDDWHAAVVVKIEQVLLVYDPDFDTNGLTALTKPRKKDLKGLSTVKRMAEDKTWKNLRWKVSGGHTLGGGAKCVAECLAAVTHAVRLIMDAPRVPAPDEFARD